MKEIKNLSLKRIFAYFSVTLIVNLVLISLPFILFIILLDYSITKIIFIVTYVFILLMFSPYIFNILCILLDLIKKNTLSITLNNPNLSAAKFLIGLSNKKKFINELFAKNYTYLINFSSNETKKSKLKLFIKKDDFNNSVLVSQIGILRVGNYEQPIYIQPDKMVTFKIEYYKYSKVIKNIYVIEFSKEK